MKKMLSRISRALANWSLCAIGIVFAFASSLTAMQVSAAPPSPPISPRSPAPLRTPASAQLSAPEITAIFSQRLKSHLEVPAPEQLAYAAKLQQALLEARVADAGAQYILLVDRNPLVQTLFIYWKPAQGAWQFVAAAPVATGKAGRFDHYLTPLGVFPHTLANPDFRAQGTKNQLGIRGYGTKGMRVYDFGWASSERGWGKGGQSIMRLQMHATDPGALEARLGQPGSKGCVRIPALLNQLIDHYGLIDADYEEDARRGTHLWLLRPDREPVPTPGRYMVVIDSGGKLKPAWLLPKPAAPATPVKVTP